MWTRGRAGRILPEDSVSQASGTERGHRSLSPATSTTSFDGRPEYAVGDPELIPSLPHWCAKRHLTGGNPSPREIILQPWRSPPGKLKTATAGLFLCLNIDVDPPDTVKTSPCAVLECWVDPHTMPAQKAADAIGNNLKAQFEGLQPKIQYRHIADPPVKEFKKSCLSLRHHAQDDAVLFYYNGHGVPKPTPSGELWCFNENYTQYVPVSLAEVQQWLGSPCIYVWDCSAAGNLVENFITFAKRRDADLAAQHDGPRKHGYLHSLQLAACGANEQLPSCPDLPADLFTSCLTSPIDIALRVYVQTQNLPSDVTPDMVMQLPGDLKDRRTPLGELNWIFTAITDTIAWTSFDRPTFTRLFRSDLLIASLFRNFLLAERIMKGYHCSPHTHPPLPPTNTHPLWASWDLAIDACLRQLPHLLRSNMLPKPITPNFSPGLPSASKPYTYVPSRFFSDQLTAFELWIAQAGARRKRRGPITAPLHRIGWTRDTEDAVSNFEGHDSQEGSHPIPDELPVVLQVLLFQQHRVRALILLARFIDLGTWAVNLALTFGIFPYITKLLQAAAPADLRPVLIFIWGRILAVDPSCQLDLFNNKGCEYFAKALATEGSSLPHLADNQAENKATSAFALSAIVRDFPAAQNACFQQSVLSGNIMEVLVQRLDDTDFLLRQWSVLCIGQLWANNDDVKARAVDLGVQDRLTLLLTDDSPEVRAAALFALGTFMGASGTADGDKPGGGGTGHMSHLTEQQHLSMEVGVALSASLALREDASPMVRKELLVFISCLVHEWRGFFIVCAWLYWEGDRSRSNTDNVPRSQDDDLVNQSLNDWFDMFDDESKQDENRVLLTSFFNIYVTLLELSVDPYPEVATLGQTLVDYVMALTLESPFMRLAPASLHTPPFNDQADIMPRYHRSLAHDVNSEASITTPRVSLVRSESMTNSISSGVASTLRRTSSFAHALKNLTGGIAFPAEEDETQSLNSNKPIRPFLSEPSRPPSPNFNFARYQSPYSLSSMRPHDPSGLGSSPRIFSAADVIDALITEDLSRLVERRHHTHASRLHKDAAGRQTQAVAGLGTGASVRDILPLKSAFYQWSCEYFREPQMRNAEQDEPGSTKYNQQVWRRQRNEQVNIDTQSQAATAAETPWNRSVATLYTGGLPLSLAFHAYDSICVMGDDRDGVNVYDWSRRKQLCRFALGGGPKASITALEIINQEVGGLILTATAEGIIRLHRNYDAVETSEDVQLVSAFRGLVEGIHMKRGSGTVVDWHQPSGSLLVGGDSRFIRAWDAHHETTITELETQRESPATALRSDKGSPDVIVASFADGAVSIFDKRTDEHRALVRTFHAHQEWVQTVRFHPIYSQQLISAGLDHAVKLWDIRGPDAAMKRWDLPSFGHSAFDVHSQSMVFSGTSVGPGSWKSQRVVVHSLYTSDPLSTFTLPSGLVSTPTVTQPSPSIPRLCSLTFHPTQMLYGVGSPDGTVRIMGCGLRPSSALDGHSISETRTMNGFSPHGLDHDLPHDHL